MPSRPEDHPIETIKSTLETILVRRFREALYAQIGPDFPVEIRDGTYPLLNGLRTGPRTATELSHVVGVDRSVTSRQASELISAGLVMRQQDTRDRRNGLLKLTDAGQAATDQLDAAVSQLVVSATQDWSDSELTDFAEHFAVFASALLQPRGT